MGRRYMLDWTELTQLAGSLNLPAISEARCTDGSPCLLAHGRRWTWWDAKLDAPGFRLPLKERDFLIACEPLVFFTAFGRSQESSVFARPTTVSRRWILGNLSLSWRALSPREFDNAFRGAGPRVPEYQGI